MGVVHLAEGPGGRQVAIKLLRPQVVSDETGRARLAREVTSLRRVRSPLVAEVYDADPWGDVPYIVTRYVPGPSLQDRVAQTGPMSGVELQTLARGLAQALVAVHDAGILHRDVKPTNVLLEEANPVLIDFGLAQLCDDSRITYSGWLLGTPGYLAPEILFGDEPTQQADVHSWAATVVFAATGRGPYGTGPAVAVMDRARRGEYDLSGLPDSLYWIVRQSLSADPRDRPSSRQLVDWLSAGLVGALDARMTAPPTEVSRPPTTLLRDSTAMAAMGSGPSWTTIQPGSSAESWAPVPQPGGPARSPNHPAYQSRSYPSVSTPAVPAPRPRPGTTLTTLLWSCIACLVVAGAVTAPGVTAVVVVAASWLLRTLAVRDKTLLGWRRRRGYRRNDSVLATICTPWFCVVSLPGAVLNAGVAVVDAAAVVAIATVAAPPRTLVYVLALGGLVACAFVWLGPFSKGVRAGGRTVSAALLQSGTTAALVLLLVLAGVVVVLLTRQVAGPVYSPLPSPPWHQALRGILP